MTPWYLPGMGLLVVTALAAGPVSAQERPAPAVELGGGWAGFVDESLINHAAVGGAARFHLTPRLSVGPEVTYMRGPGTDRDLFLLGNVVFDFMSPRNGRPPRVSPFVIAGAGLFQHRSRFFRDTDTHTSATFVGGAGVRISVTDRVYVAPDFRVGTEDLHVRTGIHAGIRLGD